MQIQAAAAGRSCQLRKMKADIHALEELVVGHGSWRLARSTKGESRSTARGPGRCPRRPWRQSDNDAEIVEDFEFLPTPPQSYAVLIDPMRHGTRHHDIAEPSISNPMSWCSFAVACVVSSVNNWLVLPLRYQSTLLRSPARMRDLTRSVSSSRACPSDRSAGRRGPAMRGDRRSTRQAPPACSRATDGARWMPETGGYGSTTAIHVPQFAKRVRSTSLHTKPVAMNSSSVQAESMYSVANQSAPAGSATAAE